MEDVMKITLEHFPSQTVVIEKSMEIFGITRNEDETLLFPRHYDKRFPIKHVRRRLVAYGWRGERLNKEMTRIVASPDILAERTDCSIVFSYGWEKQ